MSRSHKVLLVAALIFLALFAAAIAVGQRCHDDSIAQERGQAGQASRDWLTHAGQATPDWLKRAGKLFMAHTPRISLPATVITVPTATPLVIPVAPATATFRRARLRLLQGAQVIISYSDSTPGGPDSLREQHATLPGDNPDDPLQTSIVAMKQGGTLTLRCLGPQACDIAAD